MLAFDDEPRVFVIDRAIASHPIHTFWSMLT